MSQFNQITLQSISDLFINLSAGWFGAAFIIPISTRKIKSIPEIYKMTQEEKSQLKLADVNVRVAIAFGVVLIVLILIYLAFFK